MADSPLRYRGIEVVVDTTIPAEFDIAGYRLGERFIENVAKQLSEVTFSRDDRTVGPVRIREIDGYDIIYIVTREQAELVVTIGGVIWPDPAGPTERLLQTAELIAMFRGITGV